MKATAINEVFCPCGCGAIVGHPVERRNGKLIVLPIPSESLRLLEKAHHQKSHSSVHSECK
jgi:hypothetical protein